MAASVLRKRRRFAAMTILGVCCSVTSARAQGQPAAPAQDCSRLIQLASVDLAPLPGDARMLVPVVVNGTPEKLLLGTAGGFITLNQAATDALKLRPSQSDSRLLDANGYASRRFVRIDDFAVANAHVAKHSFALTPDPKAGANPPDDGVFDVGLTYRFDVEMDFARRKLNYFSPDHCAGHVVYWPAAAVGEVPIALVHRTDDNARHGNIASGAALLNAGLPDDYVNSLLDLIESAPGIVGSDIQTKVTLDGQQFTANIDTALEYSTLNSQAARSRFDVTENSPGSAPVGSLVDNDPARKAGTQGVSESVTVYGSAAFAHTFHSLIFGGVTVNNPHFLVRPDRTGEHDPDNGYLTGTRVRRLDNDVEPDISIGMDMLSKLHLYFAFPERKLYVTPAAPDVAADAAAASAPTGPAAGPGH
jgi:Aspartyl protease